MSATAERATRREIRRAFGERAIEDLRAMQNDIASLSNRISGLAAEVVTLKIRLNVVAKEQADA